MSGALDTRARAAGSPSRSVVEAVLELGPAARGGVLLAGDAGRRGRRAALHAQAAGAAARLARPAADAREEVLNDRQRGAAEVVRVAGAVEADLLAGGAGAGAA